MESTFENILDQVSQMKFSDDSMLDLMSYVKEAIRISKAINPSRRTNHCLNNFIQTHEKEVDFLKERDISKQEREDRFYDVLNNFKSDLHGCIVSERSKL